MAVETVGAGGTVGSAGRPADRRGADTTISGLDALELAGLRHHRRLPVRVWSALWPVALAVGIVGLVWQLVFWSGWKDPWVLPAPTTVLGELGGYLGDGSFWRAVATTIRRGVTGYALAIVIGFAVGVLVARIRVLRAAIGSMITGLQTMPSIAWFPLAILLFQLNESAIMFVVVLGAAPSIANGVIGGVDYVSPLLVRAGRNIGATGWRLYAYVIGPASLPAIVAGLKQGWAFAWRSLLAGELLVIIAQRPALGTRMEILRQESDAAGVMAMMITIFVVGVLADLLFRKLDIAVRDRFGLRDPADA